MTGGAPLVPSSDEFLRSLGQVCWLMGLSEAHRDLPLREMEARIQVPLMLRQLRIYTEGARPIAALTWGSVSESIRQALRFPTYQMMMQDWRSGPELVIVDCISPFTDRQRIEDLFWQQSRDAALPPAAAQDF